MNKNDFQELINASRHMAESLLQKLDGEFYPFGFEVNNKGELRNVALHDGDEFPDSQDLLNKLRSHLDQQINSYKIRSYSVTYDCVTRQNEQSQKTDAVAIECFEKEQKSRITYFFPYTPITNDSFEFGEPWKIASD